jgi:ATP-dependent helicase/nuclease subunit A
VAPRTLCGDVLILVRQRGELFEAIIRALKNQELEVAGADRLMLTEHIAVMDLMALAEALLLPQDDLALATVLRSPLFGFRTKTCLRLPTSAAACRCVKLSRKADEQAIFAEATARLDQLAAWRNGARRRLRFTRGSSARAEDGGGFSPGSDWKPTMRSTNFSISLSTTSGGRRRRCRVS